MVLVESILFLMSSKNPPLLSEIIKMEENYDSDPEIVIESDNSDSSEDEMEVIIESESDNEEPEIVFMDEEEEEVKVSAKKKVKEIEKKVVNYKYGPMTDFGFRMREGITLKQHQDESILWLKHRSRAQRLGFKGGILGLEMGLGKTAVMSCTFMSEEWDPVSMLCKLFPEEISDIVKNGVGNDFHETPNLVIASKTVVGEWKKDIEKFFGDTCPFFIFTKQALKNKFDSVTYKELSKYKVVITTYPTICGIAKKLSLCDHQFILDDAQRKIGIKNSKKPDMKNINNIKGGSLLFKIAWNWIVADESHTFANPKSVTFYSVMCLYGDKKACLTGTPLRNFQTDLYSQFRFCGFETFMFAKQFNYTVYERHRLYEFILCKDYVDAKISLPDAHEHLELIKLEGREQEMYKYYENAARIALEEFAIGTTNFANVLTLFLRLRQVCVSSYTVLKESSRNYKGKQDSKYTKAQETLDKMTHGLASWMQDKYGEAGVMSSKMKKMKEIMKKIPKGEKVLIFTNFKKVIDIASLSVSMDQEDRKYLIVDGDVTGDERDATLNMFRDPDMGYDVMFVSYKVGSEGLNLTEANHIIFMENWWCGKVIHQARRRAHRIGQKKEVHIWKIIVEGSIEERIEEVCRKKDKLCEDFLTSKKTKMGFKLNAKLLGQILGKER